MDQTQGNQGAMLLISRAGKGVANQRMRLAAYALKLSHEVKGERLFKRQRGKNTAQAIRALVPDDVSVVVVESLGVISRQPLEALRAVAELRFLGVTVHSAAEPWIECIGVCLPDIAAWINEAQERLLSTEAKNEGKKNHWGLPVGRPRKLVNPELAVALVASFGSVSAAARELKVGASTLRRILRDHKASQDFTALQK